MGANVTNANGSLPRMGHRMEHSARHSKSVAAVHAAFTSEQYWRDRLAAVGGPNAELREATKNADGSFKVVLVQAIAEKYLPSLVTKIRRGDLKIDRTESWGPLTGDKARGHFEVSVQGAPGTISGDIEIAADGSGSVFRVDGSVTVNIPLIGARAEEAIAEQLKRLLTKEDDFTEEWTTAHS